MAPQAQTLTSGSLDLLLDARDSLASGEALRLREQAGLSQRDLASIVGVTHTAIGRWERGLRSPRGGAALRYAKVLARLRERQDGSAP